MSFDLYAFAPRPDEDPLDTIEALELEDDLAGQPGPAAADRNDRILVALSAAHPAAREYRSARSISLVDNGLEIYLSRQYAVISVDRERPADRERLAAEISYAAFVITTATGWQLFDTATPRRVRASSPGLVDRWTHRARSSAPTSCSCSATRWPRR
jgi:hypothetical protein